MFAWRIWNLFIDNIYVHDCVYIYILIFNTHETIDMCYMHDTYNLVRLPHPPEGAMGRFHFAGEIIGNAPSPGHRTEGRIIVWYIHVHLGKRNVSHSYLCQPYRMRCDILGDCHMLHFVGSKNPFRNS